MDKDDNAVVTFIPTGAETKSSIDIDRPDQYMYSKLVDGINKMLDEFEPLPSSERCIYQVPEILRKVNEAAYTPHMVSIGPFHHGTKNLESMEQVKMKFLKKLVRRSSTADNFSLNKYVEFVKRREGRIRECYSKHLEMESDEFVTMILIDGCFIVELLISYGTESGDEHDFSQWEFGNITLDLILLENQVPFFVLEGLFSLAATTETRSLLDLSLNFFADFNEQKKNANDIQSAVKHFTDLVLSLYRPPTRPPRGNERFQTRFSCTDLNESGVTFKASQSKCLFGITFTKDEGVLEIPNFFLDDNTETLFRNLMALELFHYPDNSYISDYIVFLDSLINTTRDVDLLVRKKIIVNLLGDNKAAAKLFNSLCINVEVDDVNFYFSRVSEDLNEFYEDPWHKSKAMLKHDYFKTRWRAASTIAAITLLALTFIQTVCSVVSTVRRN